MSKLDDKRRLMAEKMNTVSDDAGVIARKNKFRDLHKKERDHIKLAKAMHKVRTKKDKLEDELKEVNAEYDVMRIELLPTLMEDAGLENFRMAGLGRVQLTGDIFVSTREGAKAELHKWLEGENLQDLITEGVNASTLRASIKERIKAGKPLPPEGVVRVTPYTRASIVKA